MSGSKDSNSSAAGDMIGGEDGQDELSRQQELCGLQLYAQFRAMCPNTNNITSSTASYTDTYLGPHLSTALQVCIDAVRVFGGSHVLCSYNGGKDAAVVLYLLIAVFAHMNSLQRQEQPIYAGARSPFSLNCIYFEQVDATEEFDEILDHISFLERKYHLKLIKYSNGIVKVNSTLYCVHHMITSVLCLLLLITRRGCANIWRNIQLISVPWRSY
jgi:hypothetical protein